MTAAGGSSSSASALVELDGEVVVFLVLFLDDLLGAAPLPLPFAVRLLLDGGDQLGEHPGERIHLVAAKLGSGGEVRRLLGEHALEAEHQRVAHLPFR